MQLRLVGFSLLALALSPACNPSDCQGQLNNATDVDTRDDLPPLLPQCAGNSVDTNGGDVTVSSQAALETLRGCKNLRRGSLLIIGSNDIVDLSALETLEVIEQGYLYVFNNSALTTVELPALQRVDYGIGIVDNPALQTAAFPFIIQAFGDITVRNNAVLSNLAFPNLALMANDARGGAGNLIIAENPAFTGFQNFQSLSTIAGAFSVFGNDALENFDGLDNLQEILNGGKDAQALAIGIDFDAEKNIIDAGNAGLRDFTGLGSLETVAGDIFVGFNPSLTSFAGLDDLNEHTGNIFIVGNESLTDFDGLQGDSGDDDEDDGLQRVINGSIFVGLFFDRFGQPVGAGNAALQNLKGLESLLQLDQNLVLAFNPQLEDLTGLERLPRVGKDLTIVGSSLNGLNGALALAEIGGSLNLGQLFGNDGRVLRQPLDVNESLLEENTTNISIDLDPAGVDTDFDVLASVAGDVVVAFADLDNLRLADTLTTVGGRLILHDTSNLQDLTGFETVTSLGGLVVGLAVDKGGNLSPGANEDFTAFTGLGSAALGAGGLAIGFNDRLDDLLSLSGLGSVGGDVTVVAQAFTSLNGLGATTIGGSLNVGALRNPDAEPLDLGLDELTALGLDTLTSVGGDVFIAFNDQLTDVGLPALSSVGGALDVGTNTDLTTISGFTALTSVGSLRVHDIEELTTVDLSVLANVTKDLLVLANPKLTTLTLSSLGAVGGTLELALLDNLANVESLSNLRTVGDLATATGDLRVRDNSDLADVIGLTGVQSVGGSVLLARNPSVDKLELTSLTSVGGSFEVAEMDGLTDLQPAATGTQGLATVGDTLRIRGNPNLASLKGLEAVSAIGRKLSVVNNPALENILVDEGTANQVELDLGDEGLVVLTVVGNPNPAVEDVGGEDGVVEFQINPLLPEGQVDDLINDLDGFNGDQILCGNDGSAAACLDVTGG